MSSAPLPLSPGAPPVQVRGREIARIAVPVSLEFVVTLLLNVVSQVIVGTLGAGAIAAVGLANSLTFIFLLSLGALGASVTILASRAHGGGQRGRLDRTLSAALLLSLLTPLPVALVLGLFAAPVLRLTGASPEVAHLGAGYLAVSAAALLPGVATAVLSGALRALGHARTPLVVTLVTALLSTLLGWGLVLGIGPLPRLGVVGAAWATLVATLLKLGLLLYQVYGPRRLAGFTWPAFGQRWAGQSWADQGWGAVLGPLFVLAAPLALTELVWSAGTFLYNVVFGRIPFAAQADGPLAANQIVTSLENLFFVGSIGLLSATTALVGQALGRGSAAEAQAWGARILRLGSLTGVGFGLCFAASALLLPVFFPDVGEGVRALAVWGILINAALQVVKVRNMILGAGLMPSGEDLRGVILGDTVGAFVVGLPLAVLLGLYTPLGPVGPFVARGLEELVKLMIFQVRAGRLPWARLAETHRGQAEVAAP